MEDSSFLDTSPEYIQELMNDGDITAAENHLLAIIPILDPAGFKSITQAIYLPDVLTPSVAHCLLTYFPDYIKTLVECHMTPERCWLDELYYSTQTLDSTTIKNRLRIWLSLKLLDPNIKIPPYLEPYMCSYTLRELFDNDLKSENDI